jgi:hypothetical protein
MLLRNGGVLEALTQQATKQLHGKHSVHAMSMWTVQRFVGDYLWQRATCAFLEAMPFACSAVEMAIVGSAPCVSSAASFPLMPQYLQTPGKRLVHISKVTLNMLVRKARPAF